MVGSIGGNYSGMSQMASLRGQGRNSFKKMDSNKDGSLDLSELNSMTEKISKISGKSIDGNQIMSKLDKDGGGLISKTEFKKGRAQRQPPGQMRGMGLKAQMGMQQSSGMQGGSKTNSLQSLMDILDSEENSETSTSTDSLDTNGDGIIDTEESLAEFESQIQQYVNQMYNGLEQNTGSTSLLDLSA